MVNPLTYPLKFSDYCEQSYQSHYQKVIRLTQNYERNVVNEEFLIFAKYVLNTVGCWLMLILTKNCKLKSMADLVKIKQRENSIVRYTYVGTGTDGKKKLLF